MCSLASILTLSGMHIRTLSSSTLIFSVTLLLLLLQTGTSFGQYGETIRSGRPGQSIGPFTVGARVFQVQSGVEPSGFDQSKTSMASGQTLAGVGVVRLGITEQFEVGMGAVYQWDEAVVNGLDSSYNGLSAYSLRMRSNIYIGKGLIPTIGWQLNMNLPVLTEAYQIPHVAPKLTMMFSQNLGKGFGLLTNVGAIWGSNGNLPKWFYTCNLNYSISSKYNAFIEPYGFLQDDQWNRKLNAGLAYLVNKDLQLDISGAYHQKRNGDNDWFLSMGISWRTRYAEKN